MNGIVKIGTKRAILLESVPDELQCNIWPSTDHIIMREDERIKATNSRN